MIIGIAGTLGETVWETVARGCQIFSEDTKENIVNLNSAGTAQVLQQLPGIVTAPSL